LRQSRVLPQRAQEGRDLSVDQGLIALDRHGPRLSAENRLKRFAHQIA
jgi:hypothetical protein